MRFRIAELERGTEIHRPAHLGAGFLAHQIGQPARQFAFVRLGKGAIEHVGNHQAENVVAEEFQPLIAAAAILRPARQRRNVGERAFEQRLVGEFIADPFLERSSVLRLAAHLMIVNSLLQRTETGQRQNSQARSPSYTEKKMICALPMMFSNGTMPTGWANRLSVELSRLSPIMK